MPDRDADLDGSMGGIVSDKVNQPPHYVNHPIGIQAIQITQHMNFCLGNVIKYVMRCDLKGEPLEDLRKARTYLEYEIAKREKEQK